MDDDIDNPKVKGLDSEEEINYDEIDLEKNDEEDQLVDKQQKKNQEEDDGQRISIFRQIIDNIISALLDYHTDKNIDLKDNKLGNLEIMFRLFVLISIVFLIVIPFQVYNQTEESVGQVYLKTMGNSYANIRGKLYLWDNSNTELTNYGVNSVFIPTRVKITDNQMRGECPTLDLPCLEDKECIENELPNIMELDTCEDAAQVYSSDNMTQVITL